MLNQFARVPVWGLIAPSDGAGHPRAIDLAGAMRVVLSKRLTLPNHRLFGVSQPLVHPEFRRHPEADPPAD
jgi:hypothetical protein